MKKSIVLLVALMLVVFFVPMIAKESILPPSTNKASTEDNLIFGLSTNNTGLQRSCVLLLGKMQSEKAVIPLMGVFYNNPNENVRLAAAWALCKIGDVRGVYAVQAAGKYDESPQVQATCAVYYEIIAENGKFSLAQPEESMIAKAK